MSERMVWRPTILDRTQEEGERAFQALKGSSAVWRVHDTLALQLHDLVRSRDPRKDEDALSEEECADRARALRAGVPLERYGRWVHYPWSGDLVHILGPDEFRELRSDRNRFKLTPQESERLRGVVVGVAGLSVGNIIAITLAMEGVAGHLKLADYDHLELSNMNRVRASVHELGLPKTVLAARQIFAFNPYASIQLFHEGITEENVDGFLAGEPKLDVLVEECDAIKMKFLLRERARAWRIPVLMETSDRGMLDIERFDLEPDRPSFHGLVGHVPAQELENITNERKATLMMRIIGSHTTSTRAAATLMEIDRSVSAWPQLASDVTLGGASATVAVRRLALGGSLASGRLYLDIEQKLSQPQEAGPAPLPGTGRPSPLPDPSLSRPLPGFEQVPEDLRGLVHHAALAPSGGNCQPWRFQWDGEQLWVCHDRARSANLLDKRRHASLVALGAALENLEIAAAHQRVAVQVQPFPRGPQSEVVAKVQRAELPPQISESGRLFPAIARRVSNRQLGSRRPLGEEVVRRLTEAAASRDGRLQVVEDPDALDALGQILGAGDRIRMLCRPLHREMMGELRWSAEEAEQSRDGLDLQTLELTAFQRAAMNVLSRVDVVSEARQPGRGRALEEMARDTLEGSSAMALLSFDGPADPAAWLGAGRAVQRVWLQATLEGLALQPMTAILYMFELLDHDPELFTEGERSDLASLRERLQRIFRHEEGWTQVFLVRLAHAPEASARSLRLPLSHILGFGAVS